MADYNIMKIGPVKITGWEIPDSIKLGGVQRVAVNQFMGKNKREVQVLGAQPNIITWSGKFYYESAVKRATTFDQLRMVGAPIILQWGTWKYLVVITEFVYTPFNIYNIGYDITLEVVEDQTEPLTQSGLLGELGLLDSILNGINDVLQVIRDLADKIDQINSTIRGYVEKVRRTLKSITGTANRLFSSIKRLGTTILKAPANVMVGVRQDVSALVDMSDSVISDLSIPDPGATFLSSVFEDPVNPTVGSIPVPATGNDPMTQLIGMNNASKRLKDYLDRLAKPPFVTTHTSIDANVFQVASEYYGTIDAWEDVANANNLFDPVVIGPTNLKLPPINGVLPKHKKVTGTVYETDLYQIPAPEVGARPTRNPLTRRRQ